MFEISKHTSIWDYLKDEDFLISGKDLFVTENNHPSDAPIDLTNHEYKIELLRDRNKETGRIIVRITPYGDSEYINGSYYRQYFIEDTSWRGEWYSPIKDLRDNVNNINGNVGIINNIISRKLEEWDLNKGFVK